MKIIDNVFNGSKFNDLRIGATFKMGDEYYIKTDIVLDEYGKEGNAVVLNGSTRDGLHVFVKADETVYPFMSELIVL